MIFNLLCWATVYPPKEPQEFSMIFRNFHFVEHCFYIASNRAGKIRFSGLWKSVPLEASSGECCVPCNFRRYQFSPHRVWKDKCWKKFSYSSIHQNDLMAMETLRNTDIPLVSSLLTLKKKFTPTSLLNSGKCCQLCLPADIKVQASKNYETLKCRYKLCHINQAGQSAT